MAREAEDIRTVLGRLKSDLLVLKWMTGGVLVTQAAIIFLLFRPPA